MKLFSIITVNLNNRNGLEKTISSVVNQTSNDFEYLIIDGNSTDGSQKVLEKYSHQITYKSSEPDTGIYNAMNKGIRKANGKYCLFLNSGDYFCNNTILAKVADAILEADIIYGNMVYEENGEVKSYPKDITLKQFISNTIGHPATFISRQLFDEFGLYNEDLRIASDMEFFIKTIIVQNCSTEYLNFNISFFNQTGLSSTNLELSSKERDLVLQSLIPKRILNDYYEFLDMEKELLRLQRKKPYWLKGIIKAKRILLK